MTPTTSTHLLWTGGWDSSFRVMDLVLRHQKPVQPHYIIDELRAGTGHEIDAMLRIRAALGARGGGDLLAPTRYRERASLVPDAASEARYTTLLKRSFLGSQYPWLSQFAQQERLDGLELSVHRDDLAYAVLHEHVQPMEGPAGATFALAPENPDDALELFRPFTFPLLEWTKTAMQAHATLHGFADLLQLTWFCHAPKNGRPCGQCGPCVYAQREGMAHRIPPTRRLRRRLSRAKWAVIKAVRRA